MATIHELKLAVNAPHGEGAIVGAVLTLTGEHFHWFSYQPRIGERAMVGKTHQNDGSDMCREVGVFVVKYVSVSLLRKLVKSLRPDIANPVMPGCWCQVIAD
jgi:hypothetical protein